MALVNVGFQTASGKPLFVSQRAMEKAMQLLSDSEETILSSASDTKLEDLTTIQKIWNASLSLSGSETGSSFKTDSTRADLHVPAAQVVSVYQTVPPIISQNVAVSEGVISLKTSVPREAYDVESQHVILPTPTPKNEEGYCESGKDAKSRRSDDTFCESMDIDEDLMDLLEKQTFQRSDVPTTLVHPPVMLPDSSSNYRVTMLTSGWNTRLQIIRNFGCVYYLKERQHFVSKAAFYKIRQDEVEKFNQAVSTYDPELTQKMQTEMLRVNIYTTSFQNHELWKQSRQDFVSKSKKLAHQKRIAVAEASLHPVQAREAVKILALDVDSNKEYLIIIWTDHSRVLLKESHFYQILGLQRPQGRLCFRKDEEGLVSTHKLQIVDLQLAVDLPIKYKRSVYRVEELIATFQPEEHFLIVDLVGRVKEVGMSSFVLEDPFGDSVKVICCSSIENEGLADAIHVGRIVACLNLELRFPASRLRRFAFIMDTTQVVTPPFENYLNESYTLFVNQNEGSQQLKVVDPGYASQKRKLEGADESEALIMKKKAA